jgi:Alpha/beta hydrolase domain
MGLVRMRKGVVTRAVPVRGVAVLVLTLLPIIPAAAASASTGGQSHVRKPTVSGPVTGGNGVQALATDFDFQRLGYVREEYFLEGQAAGYEKVGAFRRDGKWRVKESETAPYKTRMVVIRPSDPKKFNGTVFVEWFNATGGVDAGPTWLNAHNEILRSGAAWVGVTVQAVGVNGGAQTVQSSAVAIPQGGLVKSDPERYGTLSHPGDLYSYDIFTQAGVAIRGDGMGVHPFEGFKVKRLIGAGESQSSSRLTTYINAVHPTVGVYNGFLIISRRATPAPLGDEQVDVNAPSVGDPSIPEGTRIRDDVDVPVFIFETEYDVDVLNFADARQADSRNIRTWELAGGSHIDAYTGGGYTLTDLGDGAAEAALLDPAQASNGLLGCAAPINAANQYAPLQAVLSHLETWVRNGTAPPKFPRIKTIGRGDGIEIVRDQLGIAKGGLRTPIVRVPLAVNIGDDTNTPDFCRVFGHTHPLDAATLAKLYPNGSADYVKAFDKAVDQAVKAGVWLKPEAENFRAAAGRISFG